MITIEKLINGLVVVLEPIQHVESVAYELMLPGGLIHDDLSTQGASLILPELTARAAGNLNSRQLSAAYESAGIRHSENTGLDQYGYRGACLSENLGTALNLLSLMILQPGLPEEEIDSIRSLLLQDLRSINDNPARRVAIELSQRYFPEPYARSSLGTEEGLSNTTLASLKVLWQKSFLPAGSVISIAGKMDAQRVLEQIKEIFLDWSGQTPSRPEFTKLPGFSKTHLDYAGQQLQIALAYPSAIFGDKDYYTAKLATGILSGGMFGRLFLEVREKRGLCYSVYARHSATTKYGQVYAYAGTTAERAHETLAIMLEVLQNMQGTITQEELDRARANVLAQVIMGEESTSSRAASNATDWWLAQKVRSLDEIKAGFKAVTTNAIDQYLERFPVNDYTAVTLGSRNILTNG